MRKEDELMRNIYFDLKMRRGELYDEVMKCYGEAFILASHNPRTFFNIMYEENLGEFRVFGLSYEQYISSRGEYDETFLIDTLSCDELMSVCGRSVAPSDYLRKHNINSLRDMEYFCKYEATSERLKEYFFERIEKYLNQVDISSLNLPK